MSGIIATNKRLSILNVWVDPVSMNDALACVESYVECGDRPYTVLSSNPEKNYSVPQDPILYESFRNADLLIPDGIGVVMAARILHGIRLERVPGVELMHNICGLAAKNGYRVFVYGAKEEVNRCACAKLEEQYPGISIVGRASGYLGESQMTGLVQDINDSKAQILFLALGSPKQERWPALYASELTSVRVCQGVGGTLDTIAGTVKRAPEFWCKMNLEWLYRLVVEPKRIKRQKVLPLFVVQVILARIKSIL